MAQNPPMVVVENLAHDATNQMLREVFAEFHPKRVRIVYRNSMPKGWAGVEFEREDQAHAACRQRQGAVILGRPIACRMAEPRDWSWFENPKQSKRRRERSKWDQEWDHRGGPDRGGPLERRGSGDLRGPPFPGPGMPGPMNPDMRPMHGMPPGMPGQPPMGGPGPGMPGPFGPGPMGASGPAAPPAQQRPAATNTTDKETAPDLKSVDIREHTFFFVDFNLAYSTNPDQPIPVEIAIVAFSFSSGEKATFHQFIDPGNVPRCYLADTYWSTNLVHGIPHYGFKQAEKNYRHIYNEVTKFVSQFLTPATPFVSIYAKGAAVKNNCFAWLSQKASQPPLFCIVRNVEELVEHLHEVSSSPIPSSSICSVFATDASMSTSFASSLPGKCSYHDASASSAAGTTTASSATNTLVQPTHICALANAKHIAAVVLATFNKLEVPFPK